jgi:hypothetical protein
VRRALTAFKKAAKRQQLRSLAGVLSCNKEEAKNSFGAMQWNDHSNQRHGIGDQQLEPTALRGGFSPRARTYLTEDMHIAS